MKKSFACVFSLISVLLCLSINANAVSINNISAESYVLIDAQTGTIIASDNEFKERPMASTTKIMTTLLLLESGNLDEEFKVDNAAIRVEGSSMGLCEDDIVTKRSLCYGMMLPSGNDAANQTAVLLAGNATEFAKMMNERAEKIGLKNTNFVTPSGLHDENHYSTAYDMALLTREALNNSYFREICGKQRVKIRFGNPPYERWLVNTNKLLYLYEYCIGVKTGFTDEAGRCLVSAAEKDGVTLIAVTLNAPNDWQD
ncbi:MAG: D-alanyl-D-alanine carboxypeptidase, partial [Oscillospiraceae bacterium]|nr:D-alanyl-D-alanine carboxypeptidase [Oscillospiraceae bacterium]